jgi:hypothetical protein
MASCSGRGNSFRFNLIRLNLKKPSWWKLMSITIPCTFYGAAYAVCAVLFLGVYFGNVDDRLRGVGILLGSIDQQTNKDQQDSQEPFLSSPLDLVYDVGPFFFLHILEPFLFIRLERIECSLGLIYY